MSTWKNHKKKKITRDQLIRDFNYHNMELEESGLYGLDDPPIDGVVETMEDMEDVEDVEDTGETTTTSNLDFTQDYDNKPEENIDSSEQHILYGESAISEETKEKAKEDAAKKEPPYDPKKVIRHKPPNIGKSVKAYQRKKSRDNLRQVILDLIDMVPRTINYCVEYVMYHYCYFAFKDSQDWPAYEKAHENACKTIMRMITVPVAAIIVLNWWYLWNYTDYYLDTDKYFNDFPLSALHYVLKPTARIIKFINKYLQIKRLSAETPNSERNFYKKLWDYRPITISMFFMFVMSIVGGVALTDVMRSAVLGDPNPIFYSIIGINIVLYIFLFFSEDAFDLRQKTGSIIFTAILFLVFFIGVILFSYAGVFIVFYYFIFFSFFFIFVYNWGNIFEVMKLGTQIHKDLIFSNPFFSNTQGSVFKKVANELIRNSFVFLTQGAGVSFALYGYLKSVADLKGKSQKAINIMRLFYGGLGLYGGYNFYNLFKQIWKDVSGTISLAKEQTVAETGDSGPIPVSSVSMPTTTPLPPMPPTQ